MDKAAKKKILEKAKAWMRDELALAHKHNTLKLVSLDEFNINPFLWSYLGYYLEGNNKPQSLAKALIYPRVLGTSITTSFGERAQGLITRIFGGRGSTTLGMDLEFEDQTDGRKKYCQLKAGPNVINRDDVKTVTDHFKSAINLARANHLKLQVDDCMFCLIYGEPGQENNWVKAIAKDYVVVMGQEFWHRFTGDPNFYTDLIHAIGEVAVEFNMKKDLAKVVKKLGEKIKQKYKGMTE